MIGPSGTPILTLKYGSMLRCDLFEVYAYVYTENMDVNITEFRRQCMTLLEELPEEGVVVTKRGKAIARITSISARRKGKLITRALHPGKGKPGPVRLDRETPYDLVFD